MAALKAIVTALCKREAVFGGLEKPHPACLRLRQAAWLRQLSQMQHEKSASREFATPRKPNKTGASAWVVSKAMAGGKNHAHEGSAGKFPLQIDPAGLPYLAARPVP